MDGFGLPFTTDPTPSQRQSILGSFLRGRPRGTSQSHQAQVFPPSLFPALQVPPPQGPHTHPLSPVVAVEQPPPTAVSMHHPTPSPGPPGHRRARPPAGGALTASVSQNAANAAASGGGLSNILRRRRSANGSIPNAPHTANVHVPSPVPSIGHSGVTPPGPVGAVPQSAPASTSVQRGTGPSHRIRLVPHLDSARSLHFDPITRDVREGDQALRIGRFTDRSGMGLAAANNAPGSHKLAFKSKVVSRAHAEVWIENGKFFIKDTKSSSGTFLNHARLSPPNTESRPFSLKDGDLLQLGVDYQGGTEDIYKCVKMRVEVGREWQTGPNAFNTNAMKQIKMLSGGSETKSGLSDCCICLFGVTVQQSLFIAPCSHVYHYKCIRPLLQLHHPGFSCPLCRSFANLEEDVEIEQPVAEVSEPELEMTSPHTAQIPGGNAGTVIGHGEAMDVDRDIATNAGINAGAETEVEFDGSLARRSFRRGVQRTVVPEQDDEDDDQEEDERDSREHSAESSGSGAAHVTDDELEWHMAVNDQEEGGSAGALPATSAVDGTGLTTDDQVRGMVNRVLRPEGPPSRRGHEAGRTFLAEGMTPDIARHFESMRDHSPILSAGQLGSGSASPSAGMMSDVRIRDDDSDPDADSPGGDSSRERGVGAKRKR